jgi:hypothetical protein
MGTMNEQPPTTSEPAPGTAEAEGRYHRYWGSRIPWFVHLLWILFWIFAVAYVARYLLPAIKTAFPSSP